ncbi:MAG: sn-glycerol-1-phosphate dehydrogenase [Betaproteobacteria bacterium]|nr:sn-glycerol-1-phosphate dehydrogenase [Betaproteobacteria bacterium]
MSELTALQRAVQRANGTREVVLADDAFDRLPDVARTLLGPAPLTVVCDDNTWAAAGKEVAAKLGRCFRIVNTFVMPGQPRLKPHVEHSHRLAAELQSSGSRAVAVGSGVVNDLTKYASALVERSYICVPTAASMDGYSASGAPLLDNGFKRTLPCAPPVAVVADPRIAVAAPASMASWGYGDLAGKISAGGDWILADALGEEAISQAEWDLVQGNLESWLSNPQAVRDRDPAAVKGLLEGLLVSGFAMQSYGNSRPASGSDHQFSHLWEMEQLTVDGVPVAHGVCVGIGCLASLALYDWLIVQDLTGIDPDTLVRRRRPIADIEAEVRAAFKGPSLGDASVVEVRAKYPESSQLRHRLHRLRTAWPALRDRLSGHLPRAQVVRDRLAIQGLPVHPDALGVGVVAFAKDYKRAAMIRRRFTIFDLLIDVDLFDDAIAAITRPGGFWY